MRHFWEPFEGHACVAKGIPFAEVQYSTAQDCTVQYSTDI